MKGNDRLGFLHAFLVLRVFLLLNILSESIIEAKAKPICKSKECKAAAKILKDSIDTKTKPCDDFYQYACGNWPKHHPSEPLQKPISSVKLRTNQNEKEISEFLQQKNNPDEPESVHKARNLYSMCIDRESYNGIQLLKNILSKIGLPIVPLATNENRDFNYVSTLAKASKIAGIMMFFSVMVNYNPYNHSLNEITLSKPSLELDPTSMWVGNQEIVKREAQSGMDFMKYVIDKMCADLSSLSCTVENTNLIVDVLRKTMDQNKIMNKPRTKFGSEFLPTIYTLEELQNISDKIANDVKSSIPKLNWTRYIEEIFDGTENEHLDLKNPSNVQIVIYEMGFIRDIIKFIHERNIEEIQFGLWWKIVSTLLPYADFDILQEKIKTFSETSHEEICKNVVEYTFEMTMSYAYLKKEKYNVAKIEMGKMLKYMKKSYKKIFQQTSWLDEKTREKALIKLEKMKSLIAYPDPEKLPSILDEMYGNIDITRTFLSIIITRVQNEMTYILRTLNQINNSTTENWPLLPFMVDAGYVDMKNMIIVPAGFLGPPLYINSLKALIYGSIGFVVGHELTHGFDQSGRRYNHKGEREDWWHEETSVKYEEKSKCFLKAYNKYNSTFQGIYQKVNSTLSWDEDVSDNVGFKAALFAYRSYVLENGEEPSLNNFEDFTSEQLFTLGFANLWCESPTMFNPWFNQYQDHSPAGVRVNGVFKNSREFSRIWNCPIGTNMNPKDEKCSLW